MKKIIGILFLLFALNANSQNKTILKQPKVDKRVELLSIVFRLADSREYSSKRFPKYVEHIDKHFEKYKNHDLINYIKKKLRKKGISYDAVMSMATSITEPPNIKPIVAFSKEIPEERWGKKRATKFLKLLNQFYKDADCEKFFKENEELYKTASNRFRKVYESLDLEWYQNFYGQKPKGEFRIINGLGNGGGNYGPQIILPNGKEVIYAIMGTWSIDSLGVPQFKMDDYFPTLLHEFNHSFVNHIVENYHSELEGSGKIIFDKVKYEMNNQAYGGWKTMYAEALVRASVIKYLKDHNSDKKLIEIELNEQLDRGFLWTDSLVKELERYENNRDKYPTLESFMPEIITFFNKTATEIDMLKQRIDVKRPKVVSIQPFNNNETNVDFDINQITITFDKELKGKGYSIFEGDKGEKAFPEMGEISYSKDKKKLIIEVKLKPNKEYQFVLTGWSFKSRDGFAMNEYVINFKTKKK